MSGARRRFTLPSRASADPARGQAAGAFLKRYGRPARVFAAGLAAVAGYVDAVGFLVTGGYFVSFMSGNSTRVAVAAAERPAAVFLGLALIGAFVAGVVGGAVVGRLAPRRRATAILGLVAGLLAVAAATLLAAPGALAGVLLLAFAMGAENTVFAEDGEVRFGVTYMTGALVKLGKAVAGALFGGDRLGWAPYLLLWLGLVGGAALGAGAFLRFGVAALWAAAGATALFAALSPFVSLTERADMNGGG